LRDTLESWPVTATEEKYRNGLIAVRNDNVRFPDGSSAERTVVHHPGAVAVVALDDAQRVLMIRQYRHPVGRRLWELPAGLRDIPGEDLLVAAQRELEEEAGYRAGEWHVLVDVYTSPGFTDERIRCFLARDLAEVPEEERSFVLQHEEAFLERAFQPLETAVAAVLGGTVHNGVAAMGILAAYAAASGDFGGLRPADAPED
jgi:ADP-ribose pyrophosphatase